MDSHNNNENHMFQQMLGVCGTRLVSPGWLVLGIMVGTDDVLTLKTRHYNVIPAVSEPTQPPWTFDLTKHH